MLNKLKKNQLFTAAAAASVLTAAPVYAANISLYRFGLDRNDRVSVNNSTFPHGSRTTDHGSRTIIPAQPELILPVRAESPLTKVADTRQPMLIAHPTNFLLPSS